jgi:hypothetical protein
MLTLLPLILVMTTSNPIHIDHARGTATIADGTGQIKLGLNFAKGCVVESLLVAGRQVLDPANGVWSGIKLSGRWFTSATLSKRPVVSIQGKMLKVAGIAYSGGDFRVEETWTLSTQADSIRWKVDRTYLSGGTFDDTAMPHFSFASLSTWTGALLGTGGVAWAKLFDAPNATYGVHTGCATFWSPESDECIRISSAEDTQDRSALRFTRETNGNFSLAASLSRDARAPKHGKARFLRDRQDVWLPLTVAALETVSATLDLRALSYRKTYGRGDFKSLDTAAINELLNTIGRIGVIDDGIVGSNGWYSGYAVLHEPWLARVGTALNDPNYLRSNAHWLDYARDHAIMPDGMVKSRWCYTAGDAQPGTYDQATGFYEAQWGRLMDTQSSYVTDVADQFDLSGDRSWVAGQKKPCEAALDYLLRRDSKGNGLVEMENSTLRQRRSSDWLDIVWASYENALVNAQLYGALLKWAAIEQVLGDHPRADHYREFASRLKASFNKPVADGGFWDPEKGWYVYWREADGSVHGDNLTVPVNLTALAEGICDDPNRRHRLLETIETKMKAESLLSWPACFESFAPGEGADDKFPTYENGDIFLAWAEYGVRAYAASHPEIALKYVRQIVSQYKRDGLAFQRYLRADGKGAGDDILANNCNVITGLYRDIYGIQPKYNRLVLDPHLVSDLNGTSVDYDLRGRHLKIDLSQTEYRVVSDGIAIQSSQPFGIDFGANSLTLFDKNLDVPALTIQVSSGLPFTATVSNWTKKRHWSISAGSHSIVAVHTFHDLAPGTSFRVVSSGRTVATVSRDRPSAIVRCKAGRETQFALEP